MSSIDPFFYLFLIPPGLGLLAFVVAARRRRWRGAVAVLRCVLFVGLGAVVSLALFVAFAFAYFAGGGH